MKKPFIERVVIKNYKSIAGCDVRLGPLQFLVGRNGAGKSNFLDALAFVRDAVGSGLEHAFNVRQGVNQVRQRSGGHPKNFGIRLEFNLSDGAAGFFAFELSSKKGRAFYVKEEWAELRKPNAATKNYHIKNGEFYLSGEERTTMPPIVNDRLYLQNIGGYDEYRLLYDALRTMGVYNINPETMAKPQPADIETLLRKDGSNIAACLSALTKKSRESIREYMSDIVPVISDFSPKGAVGNAWQVMEFFQDDKSQKQHWCFPAINMSDGTLRALGILSALLQQRKGDKNLFPSMVGVEEPETALHASASGVILDALEEASKMRQVIVTTHSTEILDFKQITPDRILPVALFDSKTHINVADKFSTEMLNKHLTTAGELLRQNKLRPEIFRQDENFPLFPSL